MNNAYIRAQQCKVKEAKFPFVKIGSQYWTTKNLSLSVTPQGNTIPEVQANGNVEQMTNPSITGDLSAYPLSTGWSYGTDKISATNASTSIVQTKIGIGGSWCKCTIVISEVTAGYVNIYLGGATSPVISSNGTFTYYILSSTQNTYFGFKGYSFSGAVESCNIEKIGWSGSQELYDGIYAQTSGTVEQKTYAAVKAAAMWSNYNNDVAIGAVYGKLYNWFAVKLFQMDIDYYNAANPAKKWGGGWRIPTQAEFQTLSTYLGGDAVSGGHLKEAGLAHWNSPNTGADNSSGFTMLMGGRRLDTDGTFTRTEGICWSVSENGTLASRLYTSSGTLSSDMTETSKRRGYSVRLIKS